MASPRSWRLQSRIVGAAAAVLRGLTRAQGRKKRAEYKLTYSAGFFLDLKKGRYSGSQVFWATGFGFRARDYDFGVRGGARHSLPITVRSSNPA
jgi:hypothetical protein